MVFSKYVLHKIHTNPTMYINYPSMRRTLITAYIHQRVYVWLDPATFLSTSGEGVRYSLWVSTILWRRGSPVCARGTLGQLSSGSEWVQSSKRRTAYSVLGPGLSSLPKQKAYIIRLNTSHATFIFQDWRLPHCSWLDINLVSGSLNSGSAILLICNKLNIFCEKASMGLGFV